MVGSLFKQITGDMRREMAGVVLVALGVLGYLSLIFPRSGVLGRDLGQGLTTVFGWMAWVVPAAIMATGLLRLYNQPSLSRQRRAWGVLFAYLGLTVLFGFGGRSVGGWLGLHLLTLAALALGRPGSIILGLVLLIFGFMLITGGSVVEGATVFSRASLSVLKAMGRALVKVVMGVRDWIFPEQPETPAPAPAKTRSKPVKRTKPTVLEPLEEIVPSQKPPVPEPARRPAVQPPVFSRGGQPYLPPPMSLLSEPSLTRAGARGQSAEERGRILIESLRQFGIEVRLSEVSQGPAITRFEIVPPPGVKVSRIVNLADDIALSLAATGVRIEAPIPGKSAIGIEVPNDQISAVLLREVLESQPFTESDSPLTVALGRDVAGAPVVARLDQMPHLLVAGATGSGKSVLINVLITSLLYRSSPDVVRLLLIDPKVVELSVYNGIPHLISPVVTEPKKAAGALRWAVQEMERRYRLFAQAGVRDVARFNQVGEEHLPLVVVIIDELADLMMVAPQDVEESIARLAQMARAAGIHLVVATQRPSVDVITGTIKANVPSRIAFAVSSQVDSRTILDSAGAEKLLGRGDMLYSPVGSPKPLRVQGAFVTEKEIETVVKYLRDHMAGTAVEQVALDFGEASDDGPQMEEADSLFLDAVRIVVESGQASTSMLQRRMRVGYTRAARLIDAMEARGFIGPQDGARPRDVYLTLEKFQELVEGRGENAVES
ncbi:FtsK/SpoIIIE family DNA translocase [Sulfobacillus harzensis]|nr:DNA translocase FtsK [Sulfobacillus harzensis]